MSLIRKFAFLGVAALLAACASTAPAGPDAAPAVVTLDRTSCYGFCPDYVVRIESDGDVIYNGRRMVGVTGEQRDHVAPAEVARLLQRFDDIGFSSLRDEYAAEVTDLPTFTVTLERGGVTKSVRDYGGTSAGMPESVRALQEEIDRVANTARWTTREGRPAQPNK